MEEKIQEKDKSGNLKPVAQKLISLLHIRVTRSTIDKTLDLHPTYPSLASLADSLQGWNVETMAVRLRESQLVEIDLPIVAHLHLPTGDGYFVILQHITNELVTYWDYDDGTLTEPLNDFLKKWKGVALLVAADEYSGEPDYKRKLNEERLNNLRLPILLSVIGLLTLLASFVSNSIAYTGILITYLAGSLLSVLLLLEESGQATQWIKKLCNFNESTSCDTVLQSKAAKLWNWISWAEIGLFYFSGSFLAVLIGAFTNQRMDFLEPLAIVTILATPYSVFSIYYQASIIKKWCILCVSIQLILWLLLAQLWPYLTLGFYVQFTTICLILLTFTFSIGLWTWVRLYLNENKKLSILKREMLRFKMDNFLFKTIIEKQPFQVTDHAENELLLGDPDAPVTLTIVSSPTCGPCGKAHKDIDVLLNRFTDELNVVLRWAIPEDPGDLRYKIAAQVQCMPKEKRREALCEWYEKLDYESWERKYTIAINDQVEHQLAWHREWCRKANVQATPIVYLNGYQMPEVYAIEDLKYHITFLAQAEAALK